MISLLGLSIWMLAAVFFLYEFFLRTFVGSIAKDIIGDLHLSIEQFALISAAYYFTYGLMQIPVGILADKFGVKKIMIFSMLMCALATIIFSHSVNFETALLGRLLMGFGSSFAFVCLVVIVSTWFPRRYFAFFVGVSQFIGTMGPVLAGGPLLSLLASAHESWRVALSEIGMFGVVLALITLVLVRNKPREAGAMHYIKRTESFGVRIRRLFQNKQAWVVAGYSGSVYVSIALMAAAWGTDYLESRGLSQTGAAYMISLAWIAYAIGCPLWGAVSDLTKRRKPYLVICALFGLIASLFIVYVPFSSIWPYSILFFLLGFGASGQNLGFAAIGEHTDLAVRATAMGLNNGMILMGGAVVPLLASLLIHASSQGPADSLVAHDFILGLSFMPLMYLISLCLSLFWFKETYAKPQQEMIILKLLH